MADLSGVPGAERIVEILEQLQADPGALTAAGAKWTAAGTAAKSLGDTVASKASALDGAWDGDGAEAVVGYATQLRAALDGVQPAATAVSTALDGAGRALTTARSTVEGVADRVRSAVAALPPALGDPAGALERETNILAIVKPAVSEAENAMNTVMGALREATTQITGACGATPLHSLPPISEQPFQPAQFSPAAWQIHPIPESGAPADTAPQGFSAAAPAMSPGGAAPVAADSPVEDPAGDPAPVMAVRASRPAAPPTPVAGAEPAVVLAVEVTWAVVRRPAAARRHRRRCSSGSTRPSRSSRRRVTPSTR